MPPSRPADPARRPSGTTLDATLLTSWPLPIDDDGDKTTRGTVLVVGGSPMTPGAVLLAGIAALRMGAGRLQVATADTVLASLAIALPEAMVLPLPVDERGRLRPTDDLCAQVERADVVLVGPGLSPETDAADLVTRVIASARPSVPIVLDAAAMTALPELDGEVVRRLAGRLVVTPNRGELARLAGRDDDSEEAGRAPAAATRFGATVTSFGRVDCHDGRCWEMAPPTPGLGTSGSGDVLGGLVAGAVARCGDVAQATCWATFVHGEAGNRLSRRFGTLSFIARELLDEVPLVMAAIERPGEERPA